MNTVASQPHRPFDLSFDKVPAILRGWNPLTIAAMIVGFVVYWPLGLGAIAWNWATRRGASWACGRPRDGRRDRAFRADTGNSAFEAWKAGELERLEEERRKLAAAQAEFNAFLDQLKQAKDREEFDRFMTNREGARP